MTMKRFLVLAVILLLQTGCGYSLTGRHSSPVSGRSLHVAMFANRTYQPNVDGELRKALLTEIASKTAGIVSENTAELHLTGEIESLTIDSSAFSSQDKAMLYRLAFSVQARLVEARSGKVIWQGKETVIDNYPATADLALQRNSRDAAIKAVCSEMARRLSISVNRAF